MYEQVIFLLENRTTFAEYLQIGNQISSRVCIGRLRSYSGWSILVISWAFSIVIKYISHWWSMTLIEILDWKILMELGLEVFRNVYILFRSNNLDFSNDMVIVIHIQLMKFIYKILTNEYILHIDSLRRILQITFITKTQIVTSETKLRILKRNKKLWIFLNLKYSTKITNHLQPTCFIFLSIINRNIEKSNTYLWFIFPSIIVIFSYLSLLEWCWIKPVNHVNYSQSLFITFNNFQFSNE